jgi:hypothetical protein
MKIIICKQSAALLQSNMYPYQALFLQYIYFTFGDMDVDKFVSLFGIHPITASILFVYAATLNSIIQPLWILQFLWWIKHYPTAPAASFLWHCDPKTWRKHIYHILVTLFFSLNTVSSFLFFFFFFFSLYFYFFHPLFLSLYLFSFFLYILFLIIRNHVVTSFFVL